MDKKNKALEMFHEWQTRSGKVTNLEFLYFCFDNDLNPTDIKKEYWGDKFDFIEKRNEAFEMYHEWQTGDGEVRQKDFLYFCYDNNLNPDDIENEYWENDYYEQVFYGNVPF